MCAGSRRDLAAAGFPERGTEACGNLWHPTCGSRPLWYPSSRCSVLGAQCWGLCAANAAALLAGSPHTSAPQEAGGGAVLLSTPFPGSKSKSLFLWSSGWRPAVRQPDGKARGLSSFPCLLAADVLSRSLGLPLELCQALGVHSTGWSSALQLGCSTRGRWVSSPAQVPPPNRGLQLCWAQERIAMSPEPATPGCLCPVPL